MPEDVTDRRCCHKCHTTVTGKKKLSKCAQCHSITYCGKGCQREDWPRHSQFCIPVMVTEIPGKGKGLVASKDFKKGQVVFQESAAIIVHAPSRLVPLQELKDQISKMSEEQKNKFYQLTAVGEINPAELAAALRENCLHELDIFLSNAIVKRINDDKMVLFPSNSLMNHSCAPNVLQRYSSDADDVSEIRAIKDILKGEEVTQCYTRGLMTSSQMKAMLQEVFRFDCKCGVCTGSIPHQDVLISEISSKINLLYSPIDTFFRKKKKDWMNEASELERAVDLTKQLYIGQLSDRLKVHEPFVVASQMARDPIRLKKAMDVLKEELSALELMESGCGKCYKRLETKVERWSSEFQSKSKPTKEEIDDFFTRCLTIS